MIHRCCVICPEKFPLDIFEGIALKPDGVTSTLDGYQEMQLLQATLAHLNSLIAREVFLDHPFSLLKYFLNVIVNEAFESLDHLQLILKVVTASLKILCKLIT